jgi:hypothetical protein
MEAFWQPITAQAAATSTSNASVTNVIQAAGLNITLVFTARVSTGVMYCFDTDVPVKPLIRVRRMSPEETVLTRANSNDAQKYGVEGMQWVARTGYGASVPYGAIKVTT